MHVKYKLYTRRGSLQPTSYVAYIQGVTGEALKSSEWGSKLLAIVRKHGKYQPRMPEGKGWLIPLSAGEAFMRDYEQYKSDYQKSTALSTDRSKLVGPSARAAPPLLAVQPATVASPKPNPYPTTAARQQQQQEQIGSKVVGSSTTGSGSTPSSGTATVSTTQYPLHRAVGMSTTISGAGGGSSSSMSGHSRHTAATSLTTAAVSNTTGAGAGAASETHIYFPISRHSVK